MPRTPDEYHPQSQSQQLMQTNRGALPQSQHVRRHHNALADVATRLANLADIQEHTATPRETLPVEWQNEVWSKLPYDDVAWAKAIYYVPPVAHEPHELRGVFLPTANRFYLYPGSVVLIKKSDVMSIWLTMPEDEWYMAPMPHIVHQVGWLDLIVSPLRSWVGLSYSHRIVRACIEAMQSLQSAIRGRSRRHGDRRALRCDTAQVQYRDALQYFHDVRRQAVGNERDIILLVEQFRIWFNEKCVAAGVDAQQVLTEIAVHTTATDRETAVLKALCERLTAYLQDTPNWTRLPTPSNERDRLLQCAAVIMQQLGCTTMPEEAIQLADILLNPDERLVPQLKPIGREDELSR